MADKIVTGADIARRSGMKRYRDWIHMAALRFNRPWNGKVTERKPVKARIDFGRWIADCECGGAEYVDPDDPVFYCISCGNAGSHGDARRVIFPENRGEIETAVLERKTGGENLLCYSLLDGIPPSWNPGESVSDLRMQHAVAKSMKGKG